MRIQVKSGRFSSVVGGVQVLAALEGEARFQQLLPASGSDRQLERLAGQAGLSPKALLNVSE